MCEDELSHLKHVRFKSVRLIYGFALKRDFKPEPQIEKTTKVRVSIIVIYLWDFLFFLGVMMLLEPIKEFCETTSVHGLSFIVNNKSSLIKRIAWSVIFFISLSYAGFQLKKSIDGKFTSMNRYFFYPKEHVKQDLATRSRLWA